MTSANTRCSRSTVTAVDVAGNSVAIPRTSLKSNDQVLVGLLPAAGQPIGELRALTPAAGEVLKDVSFGDYEQFEFKGWNNDTVHGYVVKPHNYQEGKSYPVAFLIHGGPQGSFGNGWSYRWNPQTPSPMRSASTGATARWKTCRRAGTRR
ncbi:hypothetical protein G6F22_019792 [Rhizopus arrhizus]|nr:hypothetical protein G6F22_019792 [Rhizopus arrhizus]